MIFIRIVFGPFADSEVGSFLVGFLQTTTAAVDQGP